MTMNALAYAGIGSRSTPPAFRPVMANIARRLAMLGWTLRSGRAVGADSFFEEGAGACAELFLAKGHDGRTRAVAPPTTFKGDRDGPKAPSPSSRRGQGRLK